VAGRLPIRSTAGAPSLVGFEADKRSIRLSVTFAGSRPDLLREAMTNLGAELSVPRLHLGRRPPIGQVQTASFSFARTGRGQLVILFFKAMVWSFGWLLRPPISGGPTLLAPSLKVQRDRIHNPPPGTIFLPRGCGFTDGTLTKEIRLKNQRRARASVPRLYFGGLVVARMRLAEIFRV